jgi:uncharacterized SAM-binding protein YcdF (DUF218 family)
LSTSFVWLLVKPSHVLLYVAVLGVVLWPTRLGRRCRALAAVLLVSLGILPTAAYITRPLEARFGLPATLERVDGIVVLAGAELGTLSAAYAEPQLSEHGDRLTSFLLLANRFPQARLVHAGAGAGSGLSQSQIARAIILGAGIAPERVLFEDRSRSTCESAQIARDLVRPAPNERWLLVTSAVHMPRSVACFRAADWAVTPYPTDFQRGAVPWSFGLVGNLGDFDLAAHEWIGLAYYRLRGWTRELFPQP